MPFDVHHIPFKQARWFTEVPSSAPRKVDLLVVHSMESPEKGDTAESVANYFAAGCPEPGGTFRKASANYCIDSNSIVQSVQCKDVAYGAKGANHNGIHLEHAGFARQARADWLDPYSRQMLELSAALVGKVLMPKFHIPPVFLSAEHLRAGKRGITTHAEASKAFNPGGHEDPGSGFPIDVYLNLILKAYAGVVN
jgi:N-acetyl-anhydromuramyl-L-alanine amidase AmpD